MHKTDTANGFTLFAIFTVLAAMLMIFGPAQLCAADELAAGAAKGSFAVKGKAPVALAFAAAFVDQKDDQQPTILLLSDTKLPVEGWTSEFDLIRNSGKLSFTGVVFFLNKAGDVFRTDVYWEGHQSSVSGYFKLKLDGKPDKEIVGSAAMKDADDVDYRLDVSFRAARK